MAWNSIIFSDEILDMLNNTNDNNVDVWTAVFLQVTSGSRRHVEAGTGHTGIITRESVGQREIHGAQYIYNLQYHLISLGISQQYFNEQKWEF